VSTSTSLTTLGSASDATRARRRPALWAWGGRLWEPLLGILLALVAVEIASRSGLVNSRALPPATDICAVLIERLGRPDLWSDIMLTLQGWVQGLIVALVVGGLLGGAAGLSETVFHLLRPIVEFMRPVPSVALIPLAILTLGSGMESKVFLAGFAATWPILIHTMYGVRSLDPVQADVARSFRIRRHDVVMRVLLPTAMPYIATGVRIASAIALALTVSAELIIGAPGIGSSLNVARASGATDLAYAYLLVAGMLGWLLNLLFLAIERKTLSWHPIHRERAT